MIGHCLDPNGAHDQTVAHTVPVARDPEIDALIDACLRKAAEDVRKHNPEASKEELAREAVWLHKERMALAAAQARRQALEEARFLYTERIADQIAIAWIGRQMDLQDVLAADDAAFAARVERFAQRARLAASVLDVETHKAVDRFFDEED